MKKTKPTTEQATDLVITRTFDVPRELVWKAWTNPALFKLWWGPKGYHCPYCDIDLKEGGTYLNCMKSPEGQKYWSTGTYTEIKPLEKLVFTDSFADEKGNVVSPGYYNIREDFPIEMQLTMSLAGADGKTTMVLHHAGFPDEELKAQAREGWNQSFDKMAAKLKKRTQWS